MAQFNILTADGTRQFHITEIIVKSKIINKILKITTLWIGCMVLNFCLHAQTWPPSGMLGSGTSTSPWEIETAAHLKALQAYVASDDNITSGKYFKLMNDIDLNNYSNWGTIGYTYFDWETWETTQRLFRGNFDGNHKIIKNLKIKDDYKIGLFGYICNAKIENLGVENCTITGGFASACGGLVGQSDNSIISNCYATGKVNDWDSNFGGGGLVGLAENNTTITNCYADVSVSGKKSLGGLVGTASKSTISNCYSIGKDITSNYGTSIGGLVGVNANSTVKNSFSACNITGTDWGNGGLVGENSGNSTITNCFATGNVNGESDSGGLVGSNFGNHTITNCYATGNVTGKNRIGGLGGFNGATAVISYCYATGIVNGNGAEVAGLVGNNAGIIRNCVAANPTVYTSSNATTINRITGNNSTNCYNNYAFNDMVVANSLGYVTIIEGLPFAGIGKDMETLQSFLFYTTSSNWYNNVWDINDPAAIWKICDGEGLPFLRWEEIECGTGITEPALSKINIFPNPTTGKIIVQFEGTGIITIYDLLCKEVLSQNVNGNTEINISHLQKGMYCIRLISDGKIVGNSKIVKY